MRICTVCGRVSGTGDDHLDCVERRRIELEDAGSRESLPERLAVQDGELAAEIRSVLDHMKS